VTSFLVLVVLPLVLGFVIYGWMLFHVGSVRWRPTPYAAARPAIRPAPRRNVIQVKPTEIKVIDR
jgi:hypothetical protein